MPSKKGKIRVISKNKQKFEIFEIFEINDDLFNSIKKNPQKFIDDTKTKDIISLLNHLSDLYYNKGESPISDEIFDFIKDKLKEKDPDNKFFKKIGAPISKEKVKLPFPMGSLDKIKLEDDLDKFKNDYSGPYVMSDKLDGVSAQIYKDKNNKITMYSRGDGTEGQNITHLLSYVLDKKIDFSIIPNNTSIRGELIMTRKNFDKIKDKMKNARNAVAGLVNSKNIDINIAKLTQFVAYNIISPPFKQKEQMELLEKWGFQVVEYKNIKKLDFKILSDYLIERRKKSDFEVDGIVVFDSSKAYTVKSGNPDYGFAFKAVLNDQIAETIVKDVHWEASMDSYLKPTIEIEPVDLVGVKIVSVTAFNAKYVVDNNLGPGAIVKIIRSGDVIPHILEVIKGAEEPKMPDVPYKWIKPTNVDIIIKNLNGAYKDNVTIKKIVFFFKTLEVKYLDEGIIRKLVSNGYDTIPKILKADKNKLENIEGLGYKMITKIFDNIYSSLENMNLNKFMASSHKFGRGVGERKLKLILDIYPDLFNKKWDDDTLYEKIMEIKGFSDITTKKIVDNIQEFKDFYNSINNIIDISHIMKIKKKSTNKDKTSRFIDMNIVFTGFRNKEWEKIIEEEGGKISSAVSSKTSIVVCKDLDEQSSKIEKAKTLNIKLVTIDEFEKLYKL
jgi:NAD-dependent DNA ligase